MELVGGVAAVTDHVVRATPWAHGWELEIPGVGVTQSRNLREAEATVRDYLSLEFGKTEARNAQLKIVATIGGREVDLEMVKTLQRTAEGMQAAAASATRELAAGLHNAGATGTDIAYLLGVSAQRVSQLLKDTVSTPSRR